MPDEAFEIQQMRTNGCGKLCGEGLGNHEPNTGRRHLPKLRLGRAFLQGEEILALDPRRLVEDLPPPVAACRLDGESDSACRENCRPSSSPSLRNIFRVWSSSDRPDLDLRRWSIGRANMAKASTLSTRLPVDDVSQRAAAPAGGGPRRRSPGRPATAPCGGPRPQRRARPRRCRTAGTPGYRRRGWRTSFRRVSRSP